MRIRSLHTFVLAAVLVILSVLSTACGSSGSGTGQGAQSSGFGKTVQAKFAYFVSADTAVGQGAKYFADQVAKNTNNSVQVQVYPDSQLGSVPSTLQAAAGGRIQFVATTNLSALVPAADAILAPYIFSTAEQAQKALNSDALRQALWTQFEAKNTQVLGVWGQGFADLLTTKPVTTPDALQGMRIRIYDPGVGTPQYAALGANAVNMTPSQVFTALSTNAIDGIEDPVATLYGLKWYQEAKNLAETQHAYVSAPIIASKQFMSSLSTEQRQGVEKAFADSLTYELQQTQQYDSKALNELKNAKVNFTAVDKAAFKAKLSPLYSQFKTQFPDVWAALGKAGADITPG